MTEEEHLLFLYQIIDSYRKTIQKPGNINLKSPLQLTIIWFKSKKNDFQIFLLNHSEKYPDKCLNVLGPYDASKKKVFLELETDLKNREIHQFFDEIIKNINSNLKKLIRRNYPYLKKVSQNKIIKSGIFCSRSNYLIFHGNMFISSPKLIMTFFQGLEEESVRFDNLFKLDGIKQISMEKSSIEDLPFEFRDSLRGDLQRENDEMPFLGAYILPPVWIGDVPRPTEVPLSNFVKTIKHEEISGRRIIIKNDGYFGISINTNIDGQYEWEEYEEAYNFCNFFLSILLINEIPAYSIHEIEVFNTIYIPEKDFLDEQRGYSKKSQEMFDVKHQPLDIRDFKIRRKIIPLGRIETILRTLKSLVNDNNIFNSLSLLIDSYTNLMTFQQNESFILSWVLIEQYINYLWDTFLDSKNISNTRKNKLNQKEYTANVKINILALLGFLGEEEYRDINKIRKKRNKLMHEMEFMSRNEVQSAYKLAFNSVKKRISVYLSK